MDFPPHATGRNRLLNSGQASHLADIRYDSYARPGIMPGIIKEGRL